MNKLFFLAGLFSLSRCLVLGQTIILANTDPQLDTLFHLPDTSLIKIVECINIDIFYLDEYHQQRDTLLEVNNIYCSGVYHPPMFILKKNITRFAYLVQFKSILYDFFEKDDTSAFDQLSLSPKEVGILRILKGYELGTIRMRHFIAEESYILLPDGTRKKIYTNKEELVKRYTYETPPATVIKCKIATKPPGADVYLIPKGEWLFKYHLPLPPKKEYITQSLKGQLFFKKLGNTENPLSLQLNEQSYIVIFERNGVYTFSHFEPSTIYTDRNLLNSQIQ
jgi:hypothetical protein